MMTARFAIELRDMQTNRRLRKLRNTWNERCDRTPAHRGREKDPVWLS